MKTIFGIVCLIIATCVGMFYVQERRAHHAAELALAAALDKLAAVAIPESIGTIQSSSPARIAARPPATAVQAGLSPSEIIARLEAFKSQPGKSRQRNERQLIYLFGALAHHRDAAIPAIRDFWLSGRDRSYGGRDTETNSMDVAPVPVTDPSQAATSADPATTPMETMSALVSSNGSSRAVRSRVTDAIEFLRESARSTRTLSRLDWTSPPSLRLGLIEVLEEVGSESSITLLGEILQSNPRAVELAATTRSLQALTPDKFRDTALGLARQQLLAGPPADLSRPLDSRWKDFLYAIFEMYPESGFTTVAQEVLVKADGRLDRHAFDYLNRTMKSQALPTLYQAWNDPRVTNLIDRASILNQSIPYAGSDPYANAMISATLTNAGLPASWRGVIMSGLARRSEVGADGDPDASFNHLATRAALLRSLQPAVAGDPEMQKSIEQTIRALERRMNPDAAPSPPSDGRPGRRRSR